MIFEDGCHAASRTLAQPHGRRGRPHERVGRFLLRDDHGHSARLSVAVQEALESTVTADMVSVDALATSYGALGTVNGLSKFAPSTVVGVLWTVVSPAFGFGLAAMLMGAGTVALMRVSAR